MENMSKYIHLLNYRIQIKELEDELGNFNVSGPGPNKIHFNFLKNLPQSGQEYLLKLYIP